MMVHHSKGAWCFVKHQWCDIASYGLLHTVKGLARLAGALKGLHHLESADMGCND